MTRLLVVTLAAALTAAQVRDVRKEATGTATLSGIVTTDESSPRPLRRATVQLSGDAILTTRLIVTDNDGRFAYSALPPGQYTLLAYKANYMRTNYGATHPGGTGVPIAIGAGQQVTNLQVRLPQFAAISGTVYDANGEPAPGISVEALAYTMRTGRRVLSSVYGRPAFTDDRGAYRSSGLMPGDYYIAAGPSPDNGPSDLIVLDATDIDRALNAGGLDAPTPSSARPPASPHVTFAPVFFPGTTSLANASKITLRAGEERSGVDITLQLVPAANIAGAVTGPDGLPAPGAQIVATRLTEAFSMDLFEGTLGQASPDAQGRFRYRGVPPGHYVITARSVSNASTPLWAMSDVDVNGDDATVSLVLQPGASVSGRVVFDGAAAPRPSSPAIVRVSLPAVQTSAVAIGVPPVMPSADGAFTLTGAAPGAYTFAATLPPSAPGWYLRSAIVNDVDVLDVPLNIASSQPIDGAVITFSDHPTELSGALQTPAGTPTADYFIIVFATDKTYWAPLSRRIAMARPATSGKYVVRNLPPGEYFVAAVTDVELNQWFDPSFLEQLVPASTRVTLGESEKKTLDLKIAGGG